MLALPHGHQLVYLSKNSLRSLQGIQQFRRARSVSLSDNLLGRWEDLLPLVEGCPELESLGLEGNPLSQLPFYRRVGGGGEGRECLHIGKSGRGMERETKRW